MHVSARAIAAWLALPTQLGSGHNWASVFCGNDYSLAIKKNGTLWAWGGNDFSMLGPDINLTVFTLTEVGGEASGAGQAQ
jgi:alpha-tubulin suppressor-like RCC1 family protein